MFKVIQTSNNKNKQNNNSNKSICVNFRGPEISSRHYLYFQELSIVLNTPSYIQAPSRNHVNPEIMFKQAICVSYHSILCRSFHIIFLQSVCVLALGEGMLIRGTINS